jgi:hypothetical protein
MCNCSSAARRDQLWNPFGVVEGIPVGSDSGDMVPSGCAARIAL